MYFKLKYKLITILICILLIITSCRNRQQQERQISLPPPQNIPLKIDRDTIKAGQDLNIDIENIYTDAFILVQTTMMSSIVKLEKNKPIQTIHLDSSYTTKTGTLNIQLIIENKKIYENKVEILPKSPYKFIESYLGPRGVIVSSDEPVMTVAIPTDKYDNPISKGSTVIYKYQRPNGNKEYTKVKTDHLVTFHDALPQQKTGKTLLGISCGEANSNEKEFDEEPDWVNKISIESVDYQAVADARQFFKIKTLPLKDKYNNLIANGTEVIFYAINQEKKVNQYKTLSIDGIAEAIVQSPPTADKWEVYAICGHERSESITLNFQRCLKDFMVVYDTEKHEIVAGQILSYLEQYISDASPIIFEIYEDDILINKVERPSIKGFAILKLNEILLKKGHFQVRVSAYEAKGNTEFDY